MNIEKNIRQYIGDGQSSGGIKPLERYASFDYCFNYFQEFREQHRTKEIADEVHIQESCLQLGFYLASWGMLRGSSFLQSKSAKVFETLISVISKADSIVWETDVNTYSPESIEAILDFRETIIAALNHRNGPSDILVTKIMLGVFGNVPAFDRYFKNGFGVNSFGKHSLQKIADFYLMHRSIIDQNRLRTLDFVTGQHTQRIYTRAKVIDMIFFVEGANQGVNEIISNDEISTESKTQGEPRENMAGKYKPLENYLRDAPISQRELTLTLEQVEGILNSKLPPSAYRHNAWWSFERNPRQPEKQAIAKAGWKVVTINLLDKWVRLVRS